MDGELARKADGTETTEAVTRKRWLTPAVIVSEIRSGTRAGGLGLDPDPGDLHETGPLNTQSYS